MHTIFNVWEGDSMNVAYFRPRRDGPEALVENAVASQIQNLFARGDNSLWTAGSLPIGAGMPDLVVVSSEPQVIVLAQVEIPTAHILAYLRAVGCAKLETIIERVGMPQKTTMRYLNDLVEVKAVSKSDNTYSLPPIWREILPEIITIEVKVKNWRRAVEQAARNRIFAHRSFVAIPENVAQRVKSEPILGKFGIGLLSVADDHTVSVLRRPRRGKPRVWTYYYEIASIVARHSRA